MRFSVVLVCPGETYSGSQDGIGHPARPGEVLKTTDFIDIVITQSGEVVPIPTLPSPLAIPIIELMLSRGGWKDRDWQQERHQSDDDSWDMLFDFYEQGEP